MILFLSAADSEILAAVQAKELLPEGFPEVLCVNPITTGEAATLIDDLVPKTRAVVVRLLGGRRGWPGGFDLLAERCREAGVPLLAFGGESTPDAELTAVSTVPAGIIAQTFEYLRHGSVSNLANAFRFVADAVLYEGFGCEPPVEIPAYGEYRAEAATELDPTLPTVGVVFYRAHLLSGNIGFVDALVGAIRDAGGQALPVYCYSLRPDADGRVGAVELLAGRVDTLVVTVLASGGTSTPDAVGSEFADWVVPALEDLDVPVLQAVCATTSREAWERSDSGLGPLDAATQVAIPEFDGRIVAAPISFKEPLEPGSSALVYRPDPERCRAVAELAVAHSRLRRVRVDERRVALVLSNYPTKHSRVGNAVGLDTPASAVRLLEAMRIAGYRVEGAPDDGDTLVHSLIAAGGNDEEFLTDDQLDRAEARIEGETYVRWFETLPPTLRDRVMEHWGEPPGDLYVHDGSIVLAGLRFGNVFVAIQPPRGFGEKPVAIYHDPDLPPSHHYLSAYLWLRESFGAHAIVHLGKHGTLEWLPGKSLGLSSSCAPDVVLGPLPLFYPFIVNDPGEGTQAKRRAHAVVVDHLVPPMMRAETYDDLARLEQLLDEYAQISSLDPAKLPEIRDRIWDLVTRASLHHDLDVADVPDAFDDFILHLDGYLCEIKDVRIRDGLHVLGEAPKGDQRNGLLAAILALPIGGRPGLRSSVADAFNLDENALLAEPGATVDPPEPLSARTASELIDRLEEVSIGALEAMAAGGWDPSAVAGVCTDAIGSRDAGVESVLSFAAREIVPRLDRTTDEIDNLLRGLDGRYVPAGASGSPTRGLVNVLPTGRNFYSVDPRAIPSELAYATGRRLADDLIGRSIADDGEYPASVGIVVWGTAAMRTQGDDVGEVLALLGVRPVWDERSRRVCGLEVVPLEELGRPRIDVTVRISGFFRDAFPDLIALMDDAVELVAWLDEPDEKNFVARHVRRSLAESGDRRRATIRVFGSKPGSYGAGLLPLIDARNWRDDADLAQVYEVWGGYGYGRGLAGDHVPDVMRERFAQIRVAVKNVDTREHDLLDSDDYFQYHGGMIATVRALTGSDPSAYIADSSNPSDIRTRSLAEETRRVFRARVVNPRWIASMQRHGYKGAFELAATVDYLFGYDATAGVVDDWMYEAVAQRYVLDEHTAEFLRRSNPWALRAMTERLLEASDRGLWAEPDAETLEALRNSYLELDGDLEEGAS